jgi:hypothetical protein
MRRGLLVTGACLLGLPCLHTMLLTEKSLEMPLGPILVLWAFLSSMTGLWAWAAFPRARLWTSLLLLLGLPITWALSLVLSRAS